MGRGKFLANVNLKKDEKDKLIDELKSQNRYFDKQIEYVV